MKKIFFMVFLFLVVLVVNTKEAHAFVGPYTYDINSATVQRINNVDYLVINGWAVISNGSGQNSNETHNIEPTYSLQFVGYDSQNNKVIDGSAYRFNDLQLSSKPAYESSYANPHDYTLPYFDGYQYNKYSGSSRASNKYICRQSDANCNSNNTYPNYLYINTDFSIKVPLSVFTNIQNTAIATGKSLTIYMYLNVNTSGGNKTVYGTTIPTIAVSQRIPIAIQANRISSGDMVKIKQYASFAEFANIENRITLIATNAKVRCGDPKTLDHNLAKKMYLCETSYCNPMTRCASRAPGMGSRYRTYPMAFNGGNPGEVYDVISTQFSTNATLGMSAYVYNVKVNEQGQNGTKYDAFIPAFWVKPVTDSTTIQFNTCSNNRICTNPNNEACPQTCCEQICEDTNLYQGSPFCRTKCRKPSCDAVPSAIPDPAEQPDTPQNQTLICDPEEEKSITFDEPNKVVDDNGYCRTTCSEKLTSTFQPVPNVLAGMGFEYPVNFVGERTCNFSFYNIDKLVGEINQATSWVNGYAKGSYANNEDGNCSNWVNRLADLNERRNQCMSTMNSWLTGTNKYNLDTQIEARLSTSKTNNDIVLYTKNTDLSSLLNEAGNYQTINLTTEECNNINNCTSTSNVTKTYDVNWTVSSFLQSQYFFNNYYYIEKYSGDKVTTRLEEKAYYDGGRKYFTDLYERSNNYNLDLNLTNVGRNIGENWQKLWTIDVDCSYNVSNKIFPPDNDINYPRWGNTAFTFRQISLTNPFPNRIAGENWYGKEDLITLVGHEVYENTPPYAVALSPASMLEIRIYNKDHSYAEFDTYGSTERSAFIHNSQFSSLFIESR